MTSNITRITFHSADRVQESHEVTQHGYERLKMVIEMEDRPSQGVNIPGESDGSSHCWMKQPKLVANEFWHLAAIRFQLDQCSCSGNALQSHRVGLAVQLCLESLDMS